MQAEIETFWFREIEAKIITILMMAFTYCSTFYLCVGQDVFSKLHSKPVSRFFSSHFLIKQRQSNYCLMMMYPHVSIVFSHLIFIQQLMFTVCCWCH
jgi:hypothetical protein